ncbi:DUF1648 domain-containing protein [Dietzia sp. 179-F 9C3 NHS]|uniref:DUF1648 domain-containing protein n=1 Tax=Dietzia sp. 179-F 9C3 NHS TaxID=3374295 RepID=UPI00387976D5
MTSPEPFLSGTGRRLDPAGALVGVVLPLVAVAAVVAWLATRWGELPDPFPSHWGPSGEADAWAPRGEAIGLPAAIVLVTVLPMTMLAAFARVDRFLRRILLAVGAPVLGMVGALLLAPVWRALAGDPEPPVTDWEAALGAAVGLVVGLVGAAMLVDGRPRVPAPERPDPALPRAPLVELEYRLALGPSWRYGILALLVGTVAVTLVLLPGLGVAMAFVLLPALVVVLPFVVHVGPDGLSVRQAGMELLRVDARELAAASVTTIDPWAHGGVGYRLTGRGSVLLATGRGPGVLVATGSGRSVRLGVPAAGAGGPAAAERVAGVLNAAADAAGPGR